MSQLSELSTEEFEERFHITGARPVQFLLAGLAEHREQFAVHFNHGRDHFLSLLLAAPAESGKLIFDCSGSQEINQRILSCDQLIFQGRPGGILVQFTCGHPVEIIHAGARALAVPLPKFVMRLQRRESFRIETPRAKPLEFVCRLPDQSLLKLPAHDISCAGIGLESTTQINALSLGQTLSRSHFTLPEDNRDIAIDVVVRHITTHDTRSGPHWRVGLEFIKLPYADESRIQRYIAKVEHERHELS